MKNNKLSQWVNKGRSRYMKWRHRTVDTRFLKSMGRRCLDYQKLFTELRCIDDPTKKSLAKRLHAVARDFVVKSTGHLAALPLFILGGILFIGIASKVFSAVFNMNAQPTGSFHQDVSIELILGAVLAVVLFACAIGLGIIVFKIVAGKRRIRTTVMDSVIAGSICFMLVLLFLGVFPISPTVTTLLIALGLYVFALSIYNVVLSLVLDLAINVVETRFRRNYAGSALAISYLTLLHAVEASENEWEAFGVRSLLLESIEKTAEIAARDLPFAVRTGDSDNDKLVKETTARIAAGIRSLKLWVLSPLPDTYEHLIKRLRNDLLLALNDDWLSLEQAKESQLDLAESRPHISKIISSLAVPIAISIVFVAIQNTPFAFPPPVLDSIKGSLVIWIVLALVASINPSIKDNIQAAKELRDILFTGK